MTARLIVFDKKGNKVAHSLSLHHKPGTAGELRLAMATSTEVFPEWLFFFLRDHGAYIETTDPEAVAAALNMPLNEEGIIKVKA
jgi:hypothetical protein